MNYVEAKPVEETKFGKVTIYVASEFGMGMKRVEAREGSFKVGPYAQYRNAVTVQFKRPRERSSRGFHDASHSGMSTLILEGWGHPAPPDVFTKNVTEDSAMSTYSAFDPRWERDFNGMMDAYIAEKGAKVVLDVRGLRCG